LLDAVGRRNQQGRDRLRYIPSMHVRVTNEGD
jgi:hypothetical protein